VPNLIQQYIELVNYNVILI